jgi:hypothetical protein
MMENRYKYSFDDFTLDVYRKLIKLAKSKYQFVPYSDQLPAKDFILWRHDVDFSLDNALALAKIEKEEGVTSTYFILLHSEFYNVLEKRSKCIVEEIIRNGHNIGLHFDSHFYDVDDQGSIEQFLQHEKQFMEKVFNTRITAFSFHNTTPFTMQCRNWKYAGLINTYADFFQTNVKYCSDSNGYWQYDRLEDLLAGKSHDCLQILTHPEWWTAEVMSPKEKVMKCLEDRKISVWEFYENLLKQNNRRIIDWDHVV